MRIEGPKGSDIRSVADWREHAPPKKKDKHWKDDRSAKALANAWFRRGPLSVPEELLATLRSHDLTKDLVLERGWAEKVTVLDAFRGENRNNDMVLLGTSNRRRVVVALEAKTDESFGAVISKYLKGRPEKSNVPRRIEGLLGALFVDAERPELRELRYQLVHGCAAALIEAAQLEAQVAVFAVYEFLVHGAVKKKYFERNARDWRAFQEAVDPTGSGGFAEGLSGPFLVPGGGRVPNGIPLLLGKVTVRVG